MLKRIGQLEPAPPWGFFGAVNTAFVPLVAVVAASLIALTLIREELYITTIVAWVIASLVTIVYVQATRRAPEEQAALRLSGWNTRLLISLLLGVGLAIVVDVIVLAATREFLPAPQLIGVYLNRTSTSPVIWALLVLFLLILQPVADELVFRGVFFPIARQVMGAWGGLIVTSLVYAVVHYLTYTDPNGNIWYGLVSPLLMGFLLGAIRANTGSTSAAIAAHIGFNLFALLKLLVLL